LKPIFKFPIQRKLKVIGYNLTNRLKTLVLIIGIIIIVISVFLYLIPAQVEEILITKVANYNPPYSQPLPEFKLDKKATFAFKKEKYYEFKDGLKGTIAFIGHELKNFKFNKKEEKDSNLSAAAIVKSNIKNSLIAFADFLTIRIFTTADQQKVAVGPKNVIQYLDQKHKVLRWSTYIFKAAEMYNLDPALIAAVIEQESGGNPNAISPAGAIGLMQLMPETAYGLGVNPYDPEQNIMGGTKYLALQYKRFGSVELALAAYNAGPGNVYNKNYLYIAETQNYLQKVPVLKEKYRAIFANAKALANEAKED